MRWIKLKLPIYHLNVMMCVADKYVVICLDAIPAEHEKDNVTETITHSGKEVIAITLAQMNHFAGNMLQVNNSKEKITCDVITGFSNL